MYVTHKCGKKKKESTNNEVEEDSYDSSSRGGTFLSREEYWCNRSD